MPTQPALEECAADRQAGESQAGENKTGENKTGENKITSGKSEPGASATGQIERRAPSHQSSRPQEHGGRGGPDPTRFGDWEKAGRCIDF